MSIESKTRGQELTELEWVTLKNDVRGAGFGDQAMETTKEKMTRKIKEHPMVPIGCLATAAVLSIGLYSFSKGNRELSQKMMRLRVLAQGMTIGALMLSIYMGTTKD